MPKDEFEDDDPMELVGVALPDGTRMSWHVQSWRSSFGWA